MTSCSPPVTSESCPPPAWTHQPLSPAALQSSSAQQHCSNPVLPNNSCTMPASVMPELQSQHWTRSALGTHQPSSTAATQCYPTTAAQCQPQSCLSYKVSTGHAVHLVLPNTYHALGALDLQHMARPGQLDGGSRTPPLQPQNPICWFWTLDSESTCKGTIRPTQCH